MDYDFFIRRNSGAGGGKAGKLGVTKKWPVKLKNVL